MAAAANNKILIIDDEPTIRELLSNCLVAAGYESWAAAEGREGLDLHKLHKPGIALVDVGLPNENGLEVMAEIKKHSPGTLVFAMTGMPDVDKTPAFQAAKLDGFLKKPFRMQNVLELLDDGEASA